MLLHYVKRLDQRLAGIEDQTKANTEDNVELIRAVGTVVDTADILEIRLGSVLEVVSLVSSASYRRNESEGKLVIIIMHMLINVY